MFYGYREWLVQRILHFFTIGCILGSGLLDTTHHNWKLGARMRDSVNGKIEMDVGTQKLDREK